MGAGAECAAGVDHDLDRRAARWLPGRAHRQAPVEHERTVKPPPAIWPVVGDLLAAHLDQRRSRRSPQFRYLRQLAGGAVHGVLDNASGDVHLLHAAWRQLEQLGEPEPGLLAQDPDREPDQRYPPKARLSFANTPSSVRRLWFVIDSASRSNSSRCSRFRCLGTTTLTTTRRSPVRRERSPGMPRPRSTSTSCGCVPAGISSSTGPSIDGTSTVVPSAASGAATSTTVTRSSPSRRNRGSSRTPIWT